MFPKLAFIILSLGAIGCSLLQLRHERLHAASELVRIQLNVRSQDERLWKLRTEIARLVTPENVRTMAGNIGPLRPLVPEQDGVNSQTRFAAFPAPKPPASDEADPPKPEPAAARAKSRGPAPGNEGRKVR